MPPRYKIVSCEYIARHYQVIDTWRPTESTHAPCTYERADRIVTYLNRRILRKARS